DGIRSVRQGAAFDLAAMGQARRTAWIEPGDALLALDLDGDGRISSGRELFGDATPLGGGVASHGFEALRAHDDNGDGAITAEDAVFSELLVWEDNGDGVSTLGELRPLSETGIVKLNLKFTESSGVD